MNKKLEHIKLVLENSGQDLKYLSLIKNHRALALKLKNEVHLAHCDFFEARVMWVHGWYKEANDLFKKAKRIYSKHHLKDYLQSTLIGMARYCSIQEEYEKELWYLVKASEINVDFNAGRAAILLSLYTVYMRLNQYEKALEMCIKAQSLLNCRNPKERILYFQNMINIVNVNCYLKKQDYALLLLSKIEKASSKFSISLINARVRMMYGYCYYLKEDYEKARFYYYEGLQISIKDKLCALKFECSFGLANTYKKMEKLVEAKIIYEELYLNYKSYYKSFKKKLVEEMISLYFLLKDDVSINKLKTKLQELE